MLFLIKKSFKIILGVIASIAIAALATVVGIKCKQYKQHKDDKKFTNDLMMNKYNLSKSNQHTYAEQLRKKFKERCGKNRKLPKSVLQTIYKGVLNEEKDCRLATDVNWLQTKISNVESKLNEMKFNNAENIAQKSALNYELGSLNLRLKVEEKPELQNLISNNNATQTFRDLGFSAREAKLAGSKDINIFFSYNAKEFREEYRNKQGVLPTELLEDIYYILYNIDKHHYSHSTCNERFARLCFDRGFTEEEIMQTGCDSTSVIYVKQFLERFTRQGCRLRL